MQHLRVSFNSLLREEKATMTKMFISYTGDLLDECQVVKDIVSRHFVLEPIDLFDYKTRGPAGNSVLERVSKEIEQSDLFVLFLGQKYGSLCPNTTPEMSYTEFEYRQARENWTRREKPTIYAFLKACSEASIEAPQAKLRSEVSEAHVYEPYEHLDTIRYWVLAQLKKLLEAEGRIDQDEAKVTRIAYLVLSTFALFCMAGLVFLDFDPLRVGMALLGCALLIVLAKFVL